MASTGGLVAGLLVGVYFGVNMLHLPNFEKIPDLCSRLGVTKMRILEPSHELLDPFIGNKNVQFTYTITNTLLKSMNNDLFKIGKWFTNYVESYINSNSLEYIVVGEDGHDYILRTLKILRSRLDEEPFKGVKVTTIVSYDALITKDSPSNGDFQPQIKKNMRDILRFLADRDSGELMVSVYPFKKYVYENGGKISLDFATFGGKDSIKDGSLVYTNLFDYMVDTIYAAIAKLGDPKLNNITIMIGESGWPTAGRGVDTNINLARTYNQKLISHMSSGKGTPKKPNIKIKGFIRSLFNEDKRPQGESQFYGFINPDFTPIYNPFKRG